MTTTNREPKISRKTIREFFESERGLRRVLLKYEVISRDDLIDIWEGYLGLGVDENFSELSCEECEEFIYAIKTYCDDLICEYYSNYREDRSRVINFGPDPADPERWELAMKSIYDPKVHDQDSQEAKS